MERFLDACINNNTEMLDKIFMSRVEQFGTSEFIHACINFGFIQACIKKNINMVKYLTTSEWANYKCGVNISDANIQTCFIWACETDDIELVNFLTTQYSKIIDINIFESGFISACIKGHVEIVKYLIIFSHEYIQNYGEYKFHVDIGLNYACENGHMEIIDYIFKLCDPQLPKVVHYKMPNNNYIQHYFNNACNVGNIGVVKYLTTLYQHTNYYVGDINNGFRNACINGKIDVVKYLITLYQYHNEYNMIDINPSSTSNYSYFGHTCMYGHIEVVKYLTLLYKYTDYEMIDIHEGGEFPFRLAAEYGHTDIVEYLTTLYQHTDYDMINIETGGFYPSFCIASDRGHTNVVKYLTLLYQQPPSTSGKKYEMINLHSCGNYSIIWACAHGHLDIVKYLTLLYKYTNYDMVDIHYHHEYAFRLACENGHIHVINYLINLYKKTKYTPINIYARSQYGDCTSGNHPVKYIANLGNYNSYNKFLL